MQRPPDLEMRSPAAANGRAISQLEEASLEHPDNTSIARQAQHLRRLFCFSYATAITIANLAYAGGPR